MPPVASPRPPSASERALLEFLAVHRIVRANQVEALLGISPGAARRRLGRLAGEGYVSSGRLYHRQPEHFLITAGGLRALGLRRPAPALRAAEYRHDVGLAWVWLAARSGTFGPLRSIVSEREMRSHDGRAGPGDEHYAVGRIGRTRHGGHLPDLLLHTTSGHRVAVELELTHKTDRRLDEILGRYAADRRIDAVLYLVEDPRLARRIGAAAARVGASDLIHVQFVRFTEAAGAPVPNAVRRRVGRMRPRAVRAGAQATGRAQAEAGR